MKYKYRVGQTVRILQAGWGFGDDSIGMFTLILARGPYADGPGYETDLSRKEGFTGWVSEESFLLDPSDKTACKKKQKQHKQIF